MGFKRKYPKIFRRRLETEEVKYLYELKGRFFTLIVRRHQVTLIDVFVTYGRKDFYKNYLQIILQAGGQLNISLNLFCTPACMCAKILYTSFNLLRHHELRIE